LDDDTNPKSIQGNTYLRNCWKKAREGVLEKRKKVARKCYEKSYDLIKVYSLVSGQVDGIK